ncbi:TatD family hydrolase [Candidatus Woesearchaeota archaeon]|nr:TatD family hydrolase [Candidatus Woesearchaeota archaeon]
MNLIDIHCHINHEYFRNEVEEVLKRAEKAGLKAIFLSGVNPENNREVLQWSKKYSLLKASLGIYPIDALGMEPDETGLPVHKGAIDLEEEFKFMEKNLKDIIAIGEVGLDFHWADKEKTYSQQAENFRRIIRFAKKVKKPLIIHSRRAEKECLDILEEEIKNKEIPVNLHCFSGKKSQIKRAAELGYYFSVPPNIVKAQNFQVLVEMVPLTQLFTETDSPWLSPYPDRKNEPAFVMESLKKIAEIKNLSVEETADVIWKNYQKVFAKGK